MDPRSLRSTSCNGPSTTCIGYESPHSPSGWSGIGSTFWLNFDPGASTARADGSHLEMKAVSQRGNRRRAGYGMGVRPSRTSGFERLTGVWPGD
jgi:hypothetical protein